jgi:hypothetical protein
MENNVTIEDVKLGTKFCYCAQHVRVHSTGWCSVGLHDKVALDAETSEEANKKWERIKEIVVRGW